MFTSNPFAELSALIAPSVMQTYIVVMIFLVAAGTIYDVLHKKSAKYFRANMRKSRSAATQKVGGGEMVSIAIKTAVVDVAASGEFCNPRRRIAHLLTMYGFVAFAVTTAIMVFRYSTPATPTPAILPQLWTIGALMVCLGGYWFWFFIRVDVAAEGNSPFRIMRADLFVLSLLASATSALIWSYLQAPGNSWAMVCCSVCTLLPRPCCSDPCRGRNSPTCSSNPRRPSRNECRQANGSRSNLPAPADKPETFGSSRRTAPSLLISPQEQNTMPTFVYMTRCDGCGHCVDICPSDIMHIDKTYRRAYNIEPNFCWECYSCVKACPQNAIDVRGYADFAPLGPQRSGASGRGEGHDLLEDHVSRRPREEFRVPDPDHAVGIDQVTAGI